MEFESIEDFHEILEEEDDLGVVIRAHLHLERYLNAILEELFYDKSHFDDIRLSFYQKVWVAVSLGLEPAFGESLRAVNSLRNEFAHNLNKKLNKKSVDKFYQKLNSDEQLMVKQAFDKTEGKLAKSRKRSFSSLSPKARFIYCILALRICLVCVLKDAKSRNMAKMKKD